ncbi:MAG TPA: hypothetical protein ENJ82_14725 [Bacteroidetes bacterium]|nr:hypothetical protein [Bacteroidota bacterium]
MNAIEEVLEKIRNEFIRAGEKRKPENTNPNEKALEPQGELQVFSIKHPDDWHKRLFGVVCESYGLRPFRKPMDGPRMGHVRTYPPIFNDILWPSFMEHTAVVEHLLKLLMDEVVLEIYPNMDELTIGM